MTITIFINSGMTITTIPNIIMTVNKVIISILFINIITIIMINSTREFNHACEGGITDIRKQIKSISLSISFSLALYELQNHKCVTILELLR